MCLDSKDAIKENARRRSAAEQQQEVAGFVSMNCMSSYIKYAREMQTQLGRAPVNDGPDNEDMFSSNPMAVFAYSSKKLAADQKKVKRNKKKRQPILTEKQLYSRDKGLKDSDVHVLNRIPAAKHEFQAVIRLGEDKCEHAFDEEIKEVAFSAIPLLALSDDDAKHGEKMAITAVYKKHYRLLRMLFQHYVVETSKAENSKQLNFLSSTGFQSFCKSCKITDRFLTSGVVGMIFVNTNSSESEAQKEKTRASNKKKSSKRTLRMVGRLSAMMPKKNNISGVGGRSGITKGDDDNGRALREVHGLSGEKNKSKSSSDDSMNPDKMFTRAEFLESLLRLALKKYESSRATPADKLDHLIKKCLITNGFSKKVFHITSAPFRRQLLSHGPQEVIKKHSKALWRLFNWVNSLDAEVSSSNDLTVSLKEMQSMCKRLGLLGTRLSWYKVVKSFTLACDENSEEMYELGYPSFVELLCRLGDMYTPSKRPNEPALSKEVAKKLDTFFTYLINTFQKKAK